MAKIIVAIGTRPDVIKMVPVINALRKEGADVNVWWSGQGKDIQDGAIFPVDAACGGVEWLNAAFGISKTIARFSHYLSDEGELFEYEEYDLENPETPFKIRKAERFGRPDCVVVHGDDATAYACAVAAFLSEVPVAHVEAGLRTYASEPFPEEALRRMIACVARWHFCPDSNAQDNIWSEWGSWSPGQGHTIGRVYVVGNTINDTLPKNTFNVLATIHRRENWGARRHNAFKVLDDFADQMSILVVTHPNWAKDNARPDKCYTCEPITHEELIYQLADQRDLVVTDSGGLQEECAFLGIPCIVFRTATERTALLENGAIELVHPDRPEELRAALDRHLQRRYTYGRGDTSEKIAKILMEELNA